METHPYRLFSDYDGPGRWLLILVGLLLAQHTNTASPPVVQNHKKKTKKNKKNKNKNKKNKKNKNKNKKNKKNKKKNKKKKARRRRQEEERETKENTKPCMNDYLKSFHGF